MAEHFPEGVLRFAINLGNPVLACTDAAGRPGGITVALAGRIAAELGYQAQYRTWPTAADVVSAGARGEWDIAFLARDPQREATLRFTDSYITIQGTMLVRANSGFTSVRQMDDEALTINVGKGAAYDLWLTRNFTRATLSRQISSQAAITAFLHGEGSAAAGIRQPLEAAARQYSGYRVLEDDFMQIRQAVCTPLDDRRFDSALAALIIHLKETGEMARLIEANLHEG